MKLKNMFMVLFVTIAILFTIALLKARAEEGIRIYPTVCIEWGMSTNHLYTLWVADNLHSNWYKHPSYTDYTPTSNRTGKLWRAENQSAGFFKLEVDDIMGPVYPVVNTTNYVLVYTNIPPPVP